MCVAFGGKPNGISPTMLLELTSLKKPEYRSKYTAEFDNKLSWYELKAIQLLTDASISVDYRASLQDTQLGLILEFYCKRIDNKANDN